MTAHACATISSMARKYELKRRAEKQQETRQRIVEAAIQLHRTKGPGRTTLSEIARLAGVQRHTLYSHFPDERQVGLACSGLFFERNPPPDPAGWTAIADTHERLLTALRAMYSWYEQVEDMFTCVLRDAEFHPLTRELHSLRGREPMSRIRAALADGLGEGKRVQAALDLALDFRAWKRLRDSGLEAGETARLMADLVLCADRRR
jgi:AcrR family transcriptional regulator